MITRRIALLGLAAGAVAAASGCTGSPSDGEATRQPGASTSPAGEGSSVPSDHRVVANPDLASEVVPLDADPFAVSRLVLAEATAVVVVQAAPAIEASPSPSPSPSVQVSPSPAAGGDLAAAVAMAEAMRIPLLPAGPELAAELDRLGVRTVIADPAAGLDLGDREVVEIADPSAIQVGGLPVTPPPGDAVAMRLPGTQASPTRSCSSAPPSAWRWTRSGGSSPASAT